MVAQYKDKIEEALADKEGIKQAGNPVVCMMDGKMVLLPPDEINP